MEAWTTFPGQMLLAAAKAAEAVSDADEALYAWDHREASGVNATDTLAAQLAGVKALAELRELVDEKARWLSKRIPELKDFDSKPKGEVNDDERRGA